MSVRRAHSRRRKHLRTGRPAIDVLRKWVKVFALLAIGGAVILVFVGGDHGLRMLYELTKQKAGIEERVGEQEALREELIEERQRLEEDSTYVERLARERHGMAKKGERVYKVIEKSLD